MTTPSIFRRMQMHQRKKGLLLRRLAVSFATVSDEPGVDLVIDSNELAATASTPDGRTAPDPMHG